jgi:putative IMPACT (imprinted ancient) family translation regulator
MVPRALKLPTHTLRVKIHYRLYEQLIRLIAAHQGETLEEVFAADVTVTARLPQRTLPAFRDVLQEMSGGRAQADILASSDSTIVPLSSR